MTHLSAGRYYLGDPCYAFTHERWKAILDFTDHFALSLDNAIVAFHTSHGDGVYQCELGAVMVDSGLIGLVSVDIPDRDSIQNMYLVSFDTDVICENENGKLIFGNIVIDTRMEQEAE